MEDKCETFTDSFETNADNVEERLNESDKSNYRDAITSHLEINDLIQVSATFNDLDKMIEAYT